MTRTTAKRLFVSALEHLDERITNNDKTEDLFKLLEELVEADDPLYKYASPHEQALSLGEVLEAMEAVAHENPDECREGIEALRLLREDPEAPEDRDLDPSAIMDEVGEHLWGCHDVINAPASAIDVIGLEAGATFHEAVLYRALAKILDSGILPEGQTEAEALHAIFEKDQQGHERPERDDATFEAWVRQHVASGQEEVIAEWRERRR